MEERYAKLYSQEKNLFIEGAPIIVLAGALHKDKISEKLVAQLKFQSIVEDEIASVYVELIPLNRQNQILEEPISHTYENLSVKCGDVFGAKDPIIITGDIVSFKLGRIKILFADSMFWDSKDEHWGQLPKDELICERLDENLYTQYKKDNPHSEGIYPVEWLNLWRCSCGSWNKKDTCVKCGREKESEIESVDRSILLKHIEAEIAENEKKKVRKKQLFRIGSIVAVACIVIVFISQVYSHVILPNKKYEEAQAAYKNQDYEHAVLLLQELEGYKDSEELIIVVKYDQAINLYEGGKLDEALVILNQIPDYKDTNKTIFEVEKEKEYLEAVNQYEGGNYITVVETFEHLGDYKESVYYYGMSQYGLNKWEEAKNILTQIPESDEKYTVAQETIKKCDDELNLIKAKKNYDLGIENMKSGHLNIALINFQEAENYEKTEQYVKWINSVLEEGYVGVYQNEDDEDEYLGIYALIDPEQDKRKYLFVFQDAVREEEIQLSGDITGETVVIYDTFEKTVDSTSERRFVNRSAYQFQPDQSVYSTYYDAATLGGAFEVDKKITLSKSKNGLQVEERITGFNIREKQKSDNTYTYFYKKIGDHD